MLPCANPRQGGGLILSFARLPRPAAPQVDIPGSSIQRIGKDCFEGAAEVHVERFGTTCVDEAAAGACGVVENRARWFNLSEGLEHPIQRFTRTSMFANVGFYKVLRQMPTARMYDPLALLAQKSQHCCADRVVAVILRTLMWTTIDIIPEQVPSSCPPLQPCLA